MFKPRVALGSAIVLVGCIAGSACQGDDPMALAEPSHPVSAEVAFAEDLNQPPTADPRACWGQATQVFARMGTMGEHASQEPTPRLGLRNLARALYEAGILPDDTMQSLGAFVAEALGLTIEACAGEDAASAVPGS
jgi:hypothetical protein